MATDNPYVTKAQATAAAAANNATAAGSDAVVRSPAPPARAPGSVGGTSTNNPGIGNTYQYTTVSAMRGDMGALYTTDPKEYSRIVKLMKKAGYNTDGSRSSVDWYWNLVLTDASNVADKMNPYEYLEYAAKNGLGKDKDGDGSGSGSGYGPFVNTQVDLTNEFDARALVDRALNTYLGRDASAKERAAFYRRLNAAESANPNVDAGTTSKGGVSRVTSGGVNPEIIAEDFAKSRGDYAEIQATTTILDWMTESLAQDQTEGLM